MGGSRKRLPELPLLQLAVAGQDEDAPLVARRAGCARTMPLALEMPMPSEPVVASRCPASRRPDGRAGRRAGAAGGALERQPPEPDQHRVEAGCVVALGGEEHDRVRGRPSAPRRCSQATMSRLLKLVPMCPEPARAIMYSALSRHSVANSAVRARRRSAARALERTRSNSCGRHVAKLESCSSPPYARWASRDGGRVASPVDDQVLGVPPVVRVVDVEALVRLR